MEPPGTVWAGPYDELATCPKLSTRVVAGTSLVDFSMRRWLALRWSPHTKDFLTLWKDADPVVPKDSASF